MAPRLTQLNIVVADVAAAAAFYERLGLRLRPTPPEWEPHHRTLEADGGLEVDLDSTTFAAVWGAPRAGVVVNVDLDSREEVDRLYAELTAAGHQGATPPYDAFWGARYAVVLDPDGNCVGLMSPADPDRRGPQPQPPS